jgi:SagB-type dehydrogenase family enzyme
MPEQHGPDAELHRSEGMALRSRRIWELRLPIRPRYVRDLYPIPLETGVHLLGADGIKLGGESAQWVVTEFAQLLDGTRTLAELHERLPDVSVGSLLDVLQLMHMHGMLEEGVDAGPPRWQAGVDERYRSQGEFFSRYLRVTGHCRNRYDAQRALSSAHVSLVGELTWMPTLAQQLASCGVGAIHCQAPPPDDAKGGSIQWSSGEPTHLYAMDLVVCLGDALEQEAIGRRCLELRSPLLFVDIASLRLGPLTYPRESACPVCVEAQLDPATGGSSSEPEGIQALWSTALLSRATQHIVGHLTGLFQPSVVGAVETWSPRLGNSTLDEVLWLPGCPLCGDVVLPLTVETPRGAKDNMALVYHRNVAIRPWNIQQPAGIQHHLSTDVQRLTRGAYLIHSWAERVPLPWPVLRGRVTNDAAVNRAELAPTISVNLAALSSLLHYSVGGISTPTADGGHHLTRHTASGGNLGSAEVYLATSGIPDLADGLYHYLIVDHSLERLRSGSLVDEISACRIDGSPAPTTTSPRLPAAILVIVSAVQRLCAKYTDRGYSYCLLDAGLVAHRLDAVAEQNHVRTRATWQFDDERLADVLGIDGMGLAPTLLVALERTSPGCADGKGVAR